MIAYLIGRLLLVIFLIVGAGTLVVIVTSLAFGALAILYTLLPVTKVPFSYTVRNLMVRWKNTAVLVVAFAVVIGLLTGMLAFVGGMYQLTESSGNPLNVIILSDGATDEVMSNISTDAASVETLPKQVQDAVERTGGGSQFMVSMEVYVICTQPIPNAVKGGKLNRFIQMRGIVDPRISAEVHGLVLSQGTWWSGGGSQNVKLNEAGKTVAWLPPGEKVEKKEIEGIAQSAVKEFTAFEVVLGEGIAKELANDRLDKAPVKPGDVFDIGGHKWVVTGIMSTGNSTFGSEVWAKKENVGDNFGKKDKYTTLVARVKGTPESAKEMAVQLKKLDQPKVLAQTEMEYFSKLSETNKQFLYGILGVAAVMALGGALGVMNTMFAAISQRQKDIGVLRLLGFSRSQILFSFLFESLLIAFIGGAFGLALGFLVDGHSTISTISSGQGGKTVLLKMAVSGWVIGVSILFTLIMGSVGGLIPALSAMRLKPLDSLR